MGKTFFVTNYSGKIKFKSNLNPFTTFLFYPNDK